MKMRALDTLHISSVSADPIRPGHEFEVSDDDAKVLQVRGSAEPVGGSKKEPAPANKAEPAPANKAEPAPENKADAPVSAKTTRSAKG